MEIPKALKPEDLIVITTAKEMPILYNFNQPVHVSLNLAQVVGKEAEQAFVDYRVYSSPDFFNAEKAAAGMRKFMEIVGFTPQDLIEEMHNIELSYGFSTLD